MKKLALTVLLLLVSAVLTRAQNCPCVFPYTPPECWDKCTSRILATADESELRLLVGIDEDVAKKITSWGGRTTATSLKVYKEEKVLTSKEFNEVKKQLRALSEDQVEYFQKPAEEREALRKQFQALLPAGSA